MESTHTSKATQIKDGLYHARDTFRRIHGDAYEDRIKEFKEAITRRMKETGHPLVKAGMDFVAGNIARGFSPMPYQAAAVDLIDPMPEVSHATV